MSESLNLDNAFEKESQSANAEPSFDSEREILRKLVPPMKQFALQFASEQQAEPWLMTALKSQRHLDGLLSVMRHIEGGQSVMLQELTRLRPDLAWHRGGTFRRWKDSVGAGNASLYSEEDLDTAIIDGGGNGALGRPKLAQSYAANITRAKPVLYTLDLPALQAGIDTGVLSLVSEHAYDLCVQKSPAADWRQYLAFCRDHLKIEPLLER